MNPHEPDRHHAHKDRDRSTDVGRVLRLFVPYRGRLGAVLLLVVVSSLVSIASPFLLRAIVDTAIPNDQVGLLGLLCFGMVAITVITSVFGVLQALISTTVGQRVMHDLRSAVYAQLQRMSLSFFTRTRTGEVQSRIASDIGGMQATVTTTAHLIVSSLTSALASIVAMLALDWRLTVVSLLMLPASAWISRRVGRERKEIITQRQQRMAALSTIVTESLSVSGIILGRTTGRADSLTRSFEDASERLAGLEVRAGMAGRWRMSALGIVLASVPPLIYWAAGIALHFGPAISIGTLVAFTSLQQGLFIPTMNLLQTGVELQASLALFQRIFEYLDLPVEITERPAPMQLGNVRGEVRFEQADFAYGPGSGEATLCGINLAVPAGGSLGIVGATGSGKSTLSYLVPRLYDVTGGRVTLDGVDVRDLSFDTLSRAVGVVSQESYLLHASVAENLRFAKPDATDEQLITAARTAQIHHHIAELPDGYDTVVGERGYRFSGGEKQRLAIARTILRDPPVLILDEATSALDSHTEQAVQHAIEALAVGRTTITIAHRMSTVRHADQIAVLDHGRIVERGTHDDLLALNGQYAALIRRDARHRPCDDASQSPTETSFAAADT
ncbi:ABC transporter ATP-binding protein [Streptomyces kronopolitis]|uniref:ABC transporter ATP-binding protein n=1 Tax=Streptomyces kronopolitis TaxID=1612435 RepID=UPI0036B68779